MKFLRLPDTLIRPLFENEDILAIDKPYGINTHTNDSKIENSEFIQDGLIEMLEKLLGKKLHIIHRLDQTTTGVIIFGKSVEAAKKYSEFFFNREVKKTYWFVTAHHSAKTEFTIDQAIVHKGRELEASTRFQLLDRIDGFERWEAKPYTGRNHQIRIHAQAGGLPILGDALYEGGKYPFICLHNHRMEFPNGIVISSKPPLYFQDLTILQDLNLTRALFEVDRRWRLFSESSRECFRWLQTKEMSVDQFGEQLILSWDKDSWTASDEKRFSRFSEILNRTMIFRVPGISAVETVWMAEEGALKYECRSGSGQAVGLPLNQRLQRAWVSRNARGKSVLNLFSQNCGFGLAAALGGADAVISVDTSAKALSWGKRNFELSGLDPAKYKFLCRDSLVFLKQSLNKNTKFDLLVCDAPSFYRGENGVFKIEKELDALLKNCLSCLKPGGQLLFSSSHEGLFIDDLRLAIVKAQKSLGQEPNIECIQAALDCELPDERPRLKSFLIRC